MMLESHVRGNPHAWFGGGHSDKVPPSRMATRRVPTLPRNRKQTGILAEKEQDNADLWRKIRNADEQIAHLVSARIVQFTQDQGASILVFEHLGNLTPEKGKYSRRGNSKRARHG
jgi:hypothetical protein